MKTNKPFYKIWWFWLVVIVLLVIIFGMIGGNRSSSDSKDTSSNASGHTTTQAEKGSATKKNKNILKINYQDRTVLEKKDFKLSFSDNSWNAASVQINKVSILKLKPFKNDDSAKTNVQGFIIIHMSVTPNRDITTYPDQGTLVTSDGQQIDAQLSTVEGYKENWAGDIAKGVKKDGDIMFPIEKMSDINDIKNLRVKFNGYYDTDNYEDTNANHDYDMTLEL